MLIPVRRPDGNTALVDQSFEDFLQDDSPPPNQASLDEMWGRAASVRIFSGGVSRGCALGKDLLATVAMEQIAELRGLLAVREGPQFHCMCHGDHAFQVLDAGGQSLAMIGLHHGSSIRWDAWRTDAELVDARGLAEWLATRGVGGPLEDILASERARLEKQARDEQWLASMPSGLDDMGLRLLTYGRSNDLEGGEGLAAEAGERLATSFPDEVERAGLLLRWFGAGSGKCSGYPLHEGIPGRILLRLPTERVVEFLQSSAADPRHWIGALRLFAGWQFGSQKRADIPLLAPIRKTLLRTAEQFGDPDNLERAQRRFGG